MTTTRDAARERAQSALQMVVQVNRIQDALVTGLRSGNAQDTQHVHVYVSSLARLFRDAVSGMEWCEAVRAGTQKRFSNRAQPELDAYIVVFPAVRDLAGPALAVRRLKALASVMRSVAEHRPVPASRRRHLAVELAKVAEFAALRGRQLLSSPEQPVQ